MGQAHPKKVVAPVVASPQHHAPFVAGEKDGGHAGEDVCREGRSIRTQDTGSGVTPGEQLLDCMKEAAAESFHSRRAWLGIVSQNAGGSRRQMRG
jgi:hypothetical protein